MTSGFTRNIAMGSRGAGSILLGAWSGRRQKRREEVLTAGDCQGGTTLIGRTARRRSRFEPQESQSELGGGKAAIRGCCAEFEVRANGVRAAKREDASGGRSTAVTITASTLRRDEGRRARGVNWCVNWKAEMRDPSKRLAPRGGRAAFGSVISIQR
jgi:hypothetical protein